MAATFGAMMFPTDYAIQPVELAQAVETRGLDSLFFPEHTHIPTSRKSPWPGGGDLPTEYWHTHDQFVALTAAAVATKRIKLGTGICLVIERDPIVLAKEVASLDVISGGRVILGIGGGWNAEEMENHGTNFKKRWKVLRERVQAMKEIWSKDVAEYHGEFVNFDPMWCYPKPIQAGGPPVLLGSMVYTTAAPEEELALRVTVSLGAKEIGELGALKEMVWLARLTTRVCCACGAAL